MLVAILCWAMAQRPIVEFRRSGSFWDVAKEPDDGWLLLFGSVEMPASRGFLAAVVVGPTSLKWPALALFAFVVWKLVGFVRNRRKAGRAD